MTGENSCCVHGGAFFAAIGSDFSALEKRFQVINADVLDAWFPPAPRIIEVLNRHLAWLVQTSPPTGCEGLIATIARERGVESANILPGAGSSDLMFLALTHWFSPHSRALVLEPTYGEYDYLLQKIIGCRVEHLTCPLARKFALDAQQLHEELQKGYDLCVLVNPNSPTGQHVPRAVLEQVLAQAPLTTTIWLDETYVEYVGSAQSLERFAVTRPNVVVCKSMSKVYALSGMRVAYLCAASEAIMGLKKYLPPWSVSLPGQLAAVLALQETAYYEEKYRETKKLREELAMGLRHLQKMEVLPSEANFLLCLLEPTGPDAATVVQRCRRENLFLRDAGSMGSVLGTHALRIAVKDHATNNKMLTILRKALA